MVPCLYVYSRMTALASQPRGPVYPGARGISAELAPSEGKKRGPCNRQIAIATQHFIPVRNLSWIISCTRPLLKTIF